MDMYYIPPHRHASPAETAGYRSWPLLRPSCLSDKHLNFLLTGCFLQLIKIFAQLVITSQALPTLETPRSEVKSCSETSVCFILKQNKSEEISTNVRRKAGKMGMTPWSSVTQATSSHCLKWDGKTLQGFFKSGLCLGNTEKNLQLLLIPALCYVSLGIWQPKQCGFTKPTEILPKLYFGPTSRTRKTWAETQSSWKPQLRKSKTEQLLPNVHDISSATHTCNATHLSPKDEVTERVIHLQGEYSLPIFIFETIHWEGNKTPVKNDKFSNDLQIRKMNCFSSLKPVHIMCILHILFWDLRDNENGINFNNSKKGGV